MWQREPQSNNTAGSIMSYFKKARTAFRRYFGRKPASFRRPFRSKGKGKGKGKGFGFKGKSFGKGSKGHFWIGDSDSNDYDWNDDYGHDDWDHHLGTYYEDDYYDHYMTGKGGKSKGKSSGNPWKDGKQMTCDTCGSTAHFRAACSRNSDKGQSSSQASTFAILDSWSPQVPSSSTMPADNQQLQQAVRFNDVASPPGSAYNVSTDHWFMQANSNDDDATTVTFDSHPPFLFASTSTVKIEEDSDATSRHNYHASHDPWTLNDHWKTTSTTSTVSGVSRGVGVLDPLAAIYPKAIQYSNYHNSHDYW